MPNKRICSGLYSYTSQEVSFRPNLADVAPAFATAIPAHTYKVSALSGHPISRNSHRQQCRKKQEDKARWAGKAMAERAFLGPSSKPPTEHPILPELEETKFRTVLPPNRATNYSS